MDLCSVLFSVITSLCILNFVLVKGWGSHCQGIRFLKVHFAYHLLLIILGKEDKASICLTSIFSGLLQ